MGKEGSGIGKTEFQEKTVTDLRQLIATSASLYGERIRYQYKDAAGAIVNYTYNEFYRDMNDFGTALSMLGLAGKTVAVIGDTHPAYVVTYFAVVNGNGVIVPLDKEINDDEVVNFVKRSHAEAIVYTASFHERMAGIASRLETVSHFIAIDPQAPLPADARFVLWRELVKKGMAAMLAGDHSYLDVTIDLDKTCALLFTSGTTGTSKGVMLSQRNLAAATNASCLTMSHMTCDSVLVSVLPINHTYEMTCGHLAAANKGATTFINDSIRYVVKNMQEVKPTAMLFVPLFVETIHKRIWDSIEKKGMKKKVRTAMKLAGALRRVGVDLRKKLFDEVLSVFGGRLGSVVCGGAPVNQALLDDFEAFGIPILNGYGITECAPLVAVNLLGKARKNSVGRPVPGCRVRIAYEENSTTGEILVKGDNVMKGYFEDPEATAAAFTEDGWFRTGDVGYIDKDGYIYITGRKKNVIILSNGKNIYPEEIEQYLSSIDLIAECVVVGRKNDLGETVLTALIYPDEKKTEGLSRDEVTIRMREAVNEVNKNLPVFKQVHGLEIRDSEFEKTTTKKIKRYKVR